MRTVAAGDLEDDNLGFGLMQMVPTQGIFVGDELVRSGSQQTVVEFGRPSIFS